MSSINTKQLFDSVEVDIKKGQLPAARKKLKNIVAKNLQTKELSTFCNLLRRTGSTEKAARLLFQNIRNNPEPEESILLEYCIGLLNFDLIWEVSEKLKRISPVSHPLVLFYQAGSFVRQWDYENALILFERYIAHPNVNSYMQHVGQINLIQCLIVNEDFSEAKKLIQQVTPKLTENSWLRLLANCFELEAQIHLAQNNFQKTSECLTRSEELAHLEGTNEADFGKKWRMILNARETNDHSILVEYSEELKTKQNWEGMRRIDFELVKMVAPRYTADYLYFGTPYEPFRKLLKKYYPNPSPYFDIGGTCPNILDMQSGEIDGKPMVKPGQGVHRLIEALASDFYKPLSIGALFSKVYPGEIFDWDSSALRIHRLIGRLRNSDLPVSAHEISKNYFLNVKAGVTLRKYLHSTDHQQSFLQQIHSVYRENYFSRSDLEASLKLTNSKAKRILQNLVSSDLLEKADSGKKTKYRVKK